ncbi:MAG: 1-acyl-sn-glycerol-3-phosphate acyltransferase, partial [Pseudomonadota bacterium]
MKKKPVPAAGAPASAFAVPEIRPDQHIIDVLIEERCPSFVDHWTWPITRPLLFQLLGYRKATRMADTMVDMSGEESFDYLAKELDFRLETHHFDRIPKEGRVVVIANHPTGLADGVAVWEALSRVRRDIVFFANADAMRVNPNFGETIIPVEWVMDKRSPAKTRETLRLAGEAFAEEKCVVIFPSGKLAKMVDRKLTEQEWFPTAISLAKKKKAPIVPLHVGSRNSRLYYLFSTW